MSNLPTPLYFTLPKGHKQDKVYKTVIKNNEKCLFVCHDDEGVKETKTFLKEEKRSNHQRAVRTSTADGIYFPKIALKVQDLSEIVTVGLKEWREQEEHALNRNGGDYLATDLWQRDQLPRSDHEVGDGRHLEESRDGGGVADYLRNNASLMTAYRVLSRRLSTSATVADLITVATTTDRNLSEPSAAGAGSVALSSFPNDPEVVVDQEAMMSDLIFSEQDLQHQNQAEEGYIDSGYSSFRSLHLLPPQHAFYNPNPIRYSPVDIYQFSSMEAGQIRNHLVYLRQNPALWILWLYIVSSFVLLVLFGWHRVVVGLFWLSLEVCGWLVWVYVGTMILYLVNLFLEPFDSFFV